MSSAAYSAYGVCVVSLFWCHRCVNYISLHVESVMPMMVVEFQPLHNDGSIFKYIMYFNAMISKRIQAKTQHRKLSKLVHWNWRNQEKPAFD